MKFHFGINVALLFGSLATAGAQQLRGGNDRVLTNQGGDIVSPGSFTQLVHVDFNDLPRGFILSGQTYKGMTFSSMNDKNYPVMIFDSNDVSGGDYDLGDTKNEGLGKMAIVSEDGDASDPDDRGQGGVIVAEFDQEVVMESIGVKDNQDGEGVIIRLYKDAHNFELFEAPKGEDGSFFTVWLKFTKVVKIELELLGSTAIPFINYLVEPEVCPTPAPTPAPICDIELDQRIRVVPPPPRDVCICCENSQFEKLEDGKLRFEFNAGNSIVSGQDSGKVEVSGPSPQCSEAGNRIIVSGESDPSKAMSGEKRLFDGVVKCGDSFEASGDFGGSTYIYVFSGSSIQSTEFHTSCSQPIAIGDVYGSARVVGFTDKAGRGADEPIPDLRPGIFDPTSIDGDVSPGDAIVLTYIVDVLEGPVAHVKVHGFTGADSLSPRLVRSTNHQFVYTYSYIVPADSSYPASFKTGAKVHAKSAISGTKCFARSEITYIVDKPPFLGDVCETCGKPRALTFVYQPGTEDLTAPDSKAELTTIRTPPSDMASRVVVSAKDDGSEKIYFEGNLVPGDVFVASVNKSVDKFESNTFILVFDGSTIIQTMEYHTSCSGTIRLGDVLGSIKLTEYQGETCSL